MFKKASFSLLLLGLLSCDEQISSIHIFKDILPDSNGGRLNIIVVARESLWQSIAGDHLRKLLTSPQPILPQPEALYTVHQIEPLQFNKLLMRSRNIIILQEGEDIYRVEENKWANPQLVTIISASSPEELVEKIWQKGKELKVRIRALEVKVLQKRLLNNSIPLLKGLETHHVSLQIPKSFDLEVQEEDLFIFWNKTLKTDQGIIIYFWPLKVDQAIVGNDIINYRDSITQLYVLGEREGSYMKTEDLISAESTIIELNGQFAIETRGLWRMVGDFKGGAFINYTIYDEIHDQIVTLDAFLFAPEMKKRNILFELEAILKTFEIID